MRVAHVLRKYHPGEWGGTETAVQRLMEGLRAQQVGLLVYCPKLKKPCTFDPLVAAGHRVIRFRYFLPVWRLSPQQRDQLIAVGGNLMSFDLLWKLQREPGLSVIHTHALNRLGGIAATIARVRRLPLVVTIHGGVLDLPQAIHEQLIKPLRGGLEWGKIFGWLLRSRQVLDQADAIITCNRREAELLRAKYPGKIVFVQPHGVLVREYEQDRRAEAQRAYPALEDRQVLLAVGRLDPVKNQEWLAQQFPKALEGHPNLHLVLAGACMDESYGKLIKKQIRNLGLEERVTMTGGLPPGDARLIGLLQSAAVVVLPSRSETFGLVILEAWAAGTPVVASRTSGALDLVREGENGWLFDPAEPQEFHAALNEALLEPERARQFAEAGRRRVQAEYDGTVLAGRVKHLYDELVSDF